MKTPFKMKGWSPFKQDKWGMYNPDHMPKPAAGDPGSPVIGTGTGGSALPQRIIRKKTGRSQEWIDATAENNERYNPTPDN